MDSLQTIPLFGRGFSSKSPIATTQKMVNAYFDPSFDADKAPTTYYGTPGLTLFSDLGGPLRGGIALYLPQFGGTYIYAVVGNIFYSINANGTIINGGNIFNATGPVFFAWNGTQLMFVDGANGWIFVPGSVPLQQIVSVNFPKAPTTCTWIGGYFVVTIGTSGKFQWSAVNDGTTWAALDFATAETSPDNLQRAEADSGELMLFGDRTTEFWGLSGDANVFRRIGSSAEEWGIVSATTVAKFHTGLAFLAQNRLGEVQAGALNGHQFVPFSGSDPEINHDLNNRTRTQLQSATAFSYFMDGHSFYQLNFPDKSYLYDGLTDSWSQVTSSSTFGARHYADLRLALSQQPLVADYRNGRIYLLDKTAYLDNGDPIISELTFKHIFSNGNRVTVRELVVELEAGDGLVTGQGSDPQIMASWSHDGGRTFGNEIWTSAGQIGQYTRRAVWRNLGRQRDGVFKFRISDPIKRVFTSAAVRVAP